jgi:hypothetical protein
MITQRPISTQGPDRAWYGTIALVLLVFTMLALHGCAADPTEGYSFKSTHPDDVATIAVPIFENTTYNRGVEFDLTDALIKEIEARTPYKVTSLERADTMLTGRIRSVELEQLSKSPLTGLSEEVIVTVTIDFEWQDLQTGKPRLRRESFAGHGLFVPSRPTGERIELGKLAAVEQLARDVVAEMRGAW